MISGYYERDIRVLRGEEQARLGHKALNVAMLVEGIDSLHALHKAGLWQESPLEIPYRMSRYRGRRKQVPSNREAINELKWWKSDGPDMLIRDFNRAFREFGYSIDRERIVQFAKQGKRGVPRAKLLADALLRL